MECARCREQIQDDDKYEYYGQILCEDCYIGAIEPPRSCDVAAVHSAKKNREMQGHSGTEGLTELQRDIYNYVKQQGKATKPEIAKKFKLADWELDKQFAVLRHCELLKGRKIEGKIYLLPFEAE